MSVTFRYANFEEYPAIRDFLDTYWAKDHIYVRDAALFQWTFDRAPLWAEPGYSFALGHADGELVGILGGIPFEFNCYGKRSTGIWIANYVIRPDYRKGPTALQLLSMFRRPCFDPVIAFGLNPATATIYRVLHGQLPPNIPRHFVVLPDAMERMVNLLLLAHPDWPRERAEQLAEAFRLRAIPAAPDPGSPRLPDQWDERDWPALAERSAGAARHRAYLTWRYLAHPRFEYRLIVIRCGASHGLAVWRLETIRRAVSGGREDVDRIGRLVEFLPVSEANAAALAAAFLNQLKEAGALGGDFYGYYGLSRCGLAQNGLLSVDTAPDGEMIPSRLQPLDGKSGAIHSAIFRSEGVPACTLESDCPWYWTKSDSDQDRPN